jgi:hypothetical protein
MGEVAGDDPRRVRARSAKGRLKGTRVVCRAVAVDDDVAPAAMQVPAYLTADAAGAASDQNKWTAHCIFFNGKAPARFVRFHVGDHKAQGNHGWKTPSNDLCCGASYFFQVTEHKAKKKNTTNPTKKRG